MKLALALSALVAVATLAACGSGAQLAALEIGHFAPISELRSPFTRWVATGIVVRKATMEFAGLPSAPQ